MQLRRDLHRRLLLPPDRPLLRAANALTFVLESNGNSAGYLRDVHEGLEPPCIQGGTRHVIWGSYTYHHYMQARSFPWSLSTFQQCLSLRIMLA